MRSHSLYARLRQCPVHDRAEPLRIQRVSAGDAQMLDPERQSVTYEPRVHQWAYFAITATPQGLPPTLTRRCTVPLAMSRKETSPELPLAV